MTEINNLRTVGGLQYMERQWHAKQARETAAAELAELDRAWRALADAPAKDAEALEAEALRLLADTATAYRSLALWAGKAQLPPWQVDEGYLVIGTVRLRLTVDMLAAWMEGEAGG